MIYSQKNHFKFGYNQSAFNLRQTENDKWWIEYGRCERPPLDFRSECVATAKTIDSYAKGKSALLFSGGADSEVMVRAFHESKVPFQVYILRYKEDLNDFDIQFAIQCCSELSIHPHFIDLDLIQFFEEQVFTYAESVKSVSPQFCVTMWAMDQIQGFPVLGGGECYLEKQENGEWVMFEREKVASWYRHLILKQRSGSAGFFQFTPELILSYLKDPMIIGLTNNETTYVNSAQIKLDFYQRHFSIADRKKYTGFERVMDWDKKIRTELLRKYPSANSIIKSKVNDLRESLA